MTGHEQRSAAGRGRIALVPVVLVLLLLAGGGVMLLPRLITESARRGSWLLQGLTSPLFIFCSLMAVGCLMGLTVLGAALCRLGMRHRRRDPEAGTAMIEFALVLPFALMFGLLLAQASLLMVGNLCVHYSAYCAARTAIVAVPDGPRYPEMAEARASGEEIPNVLLSNYFSARTSGSEKGSRVWWAAVWAVMPVSSSSPDLPEADTYSLRTGLGDFFSGYGQDTPSWVYDLFGRKIQYAQEYTAVDIAPPMDGDKYRENEDIRVRVEHTLYLSVPFANRIFAQFRDGVRLDFGDGEYGTIVRATCTLTNEGGQDFVEREPFPREIW